jgi:hypothetical protein
MSIRTRTFYRVYCNTCGKGAHGSDYEWEEEIECVFIEAEASGWTASGDEIHTCPECQPPVGDDG